MNKEQYKEYIASGEWKRRAEEAKERAGYRCQVCNSDGEIHAHHRTYERLGAELPEDITVLCSNCHAVFHDKLACNEAARAMLRDLRDALSRWGIPSYHDENYKCDNQWTYYEKAKELVRAGSAWLGCGRGDCNGLSAFYDEAMTFISDYLYLAHDSCPKCYKPDGNGEQ